MTGIIPINKGESITSFLAVNKVRRIVNEKKCGHTGTLDPMATGVLPVAMGGATRFIELLPNHNKSYVATFRTGIRTDTLDIWGKVLEETGKTVDISDVSAVLPEFSGKIMQLPPMYSALKKDGVRLYELARRGEEVEREKRACEIFSIAASEAPNGEFSLSVTCSSGTYIRSLISDIGDILSVGAVMTSLKRTEACGIAICSCVTLSELSELSENGELQKAVMPLEVLLKDYPAVFVSPAQGVRFKNGGELSRDRFDDKKINGICRVYSENEFLGLGEIPENGECMSVKRVYVER